MAEDDGRSTAHDDDGRSTARDDGRITAHDGGVTAHDGGRITARDARTAGVPVPGGGRRTSSHRAGYATLGWALVYGGFGLVATSAGSALFHRAAEPLPVALNWVVVAVAAVTVITVPAAVRPGPRIPRAVVLATLAGLCAVSGVAAFGLLMDVITLVFAQTVGSWTGTANRALAAIGVVLLVATARAYRSAAYGTCPRCGSVHTSPAVPSAALPAGPSVASPAVPPVASPAALPVVRGGPEPVPASRRVRLTAYLGAAAFLPYAAMKTTWALGGTFAGVGGAEMTATMERNGASGLMLTLERWGVDVTALLAALGVFLILGLVRPWGQVFPRWTFALRGRRVPRWLPLTPALVGAASLAPYGMVGLVYAVLGTAGVVAVPRGDFPTPGDALLVIWFGLGAFAVYGVALAVAARSYLLRTRPVCPLAGTGAVT
ncbi:hypothetical protein GCM10017559_52740 [Streptosporangium longisporum]|uniref:Uncharacterized protein n=2 Tax=Streptosporangium longisporum TaxID=46187 RepID=A0ABP6KQP5_9ACTN